MLHFSQLNSNQMHKKKTTQQQFTPQVQPLNNQETSKVRKPTKQSKRQMQTDLLNLLQYRQKQFRVFFPIINDSESESYYQEKHAEETHQEDVKSWFKSLTVEQRMNALTTTSPYLAEILINMQRQNLRKGPTMFALQSKTSFQSKIGLQNYLINDQNMLYKHLKDKEQQEALYHQNYAQHFYLGNTYKYNQDMLYQAKMIEQERQQAEQLESEHPAHVYPQFFEDTYYCRIQHNHEIMTLKEQEPLKWEALKTLIANVRFADQFKYLDTITSSMALVKDPDFFFETMNNVTNGQSFSQRSNFIFEPKLGIHQIESPAWFKSERFQCFATWLAAVFEENIWAHFNFSDKKYNSVEKLDYLFDSKEIQEGLYKIEQVAVQTLAKAWLNSIPQLKQDVLKELKDTLGSDHNERAYLREEYFLYDSHYIDFTIHDSELNDLISNFNKMQSGSRVTTMIPKLKECMDLVMNLFLSNVKTIERSQDIMNRTMLTLIKQMHQDQVIKELLDTQDSHENAGTGKKKKKKKGKQDANIESGQEKLDITLKSSGKQKIIINNQTNMNAQQLTNTSLGVQHLDLEVEALQAMQEDDQIIDQVALIENPDHESARSTSQDKHSANSEFIHPITPTKQNDQIAIDCEVKQLSKDYVSDMLNKIENESYASLPTAANESADKITDVNEKKTPSKNKKKKKKDQVLKSNELLYEKQLQPSNNSAAPISPNIQQRNKLQTELIVLASVSEPASRESSKVKQNKKDDPEEKILTRSNKPAMKQETDLVLNKAQSAIVTQTPQLESPPKAERQPSQDEVAGNEESKLGGRRRIRKKTKNILDPTEIMNQFIHSLASKKDDKGGRKNNNHNQSRQNSTQKNNNNNKNLIADKKIQDKPTEYSKKPPQIPLGNKDTQSQGNRKNKKKSDDPRQEDQSSSQQKKDRKPKEQTMYQEKNTSQDKSKTKVDSPPITQFSEQTKPVPVSKEEEKSSEGSQQPYSDYRKRAVFNALVPDHTRFSMNSISTSKINAFSPSFKPKDFQPTQATTPGLPEAGKSLATVLQNQKQHSEFIPDNIPSFTPTEKQNPLQQINLHEVKSFEPSQFNPFVLDIDKTSSSSTTTEFYPKQKLEPIGQKSMSMNNQPYIPTFVPTQQQQNSWNKPQKVNISEQLNFVPQNSTTSSHSSNPNFSYNDRDRTSQPKVHIQEFQPYNYQQRFSPSQESNTNANMNAAPFSYPNTNNVFVPKQQIYMPKQTYTTTTTTNSSGVGMPPLNYNDIQQYSQGIQEIINNSSNKKQNNTGSSNSSEERKHDSQTSSNQFNFPQQFGQVSGQIGQINQMNSYNINQFGNLNMAQNFSNPFQQFGPMMNMPFLSGSSNPQYYNQQQMYPNYQQQYYDNILQNIDYKFYEKFDNDIYDEVNKIQRALDLTKDERNFVLSKLQEMCEEVFMEKKEDNISGSPKKPSNNLVGGKKPKIQQFGSLITGLALESSDMDMAVTNLFLPDREKMVESLDIFAENLRKWELIQDLNAISTASIPVIKANVDLNMLRKEMNSRDKPFIDDSKHHDFGQTQTGVRKEERKIREIPPEMAKLKIDITFDDNQNTVNSLNEQLYDTTMPKTHQGLASCKLIKNYVEHYKCLKEVSIILKQFLSKMDLNSPYHGGVSSYSTVLLLVAYMNKWNLKMSPSLTPSRLLMGFLDYYSYYFNVSLFGIDVSNNGSFYEHNSPESNFVILDPLNCQNNTTRNSFLTNEIIKSFRKAFNSLKNLLLQYQQMQNPNITDNLVDLILQRNQFNLEHSFENSHQSSDKISSSSKTEGEDVNRSKNNSPQDDKQPQLQQQSKQTSSQQPIQIQIQQIQQIQILQQMQQP